MTGLGLSPELPHHNGNGSPWWFKAIAAFGLPSCLLCGVLYWMLQYAAVMMANQVDHTAALAKQVQTMDGAITAHIDSSGKAFAEILFYLRGICINFAETAEERRNCVPPRVNAP